MSFWKKSLHFIWILTCLLTKMSILGVDYGDKNIGVAVSCPSKLTALGVQTIRRGSPDSFKQPILILREIMRRYCVSALVLGYPKNMDGSEGERCAKTLEFKARLQRNFKSLDIVLWDERLTTLSEKRTMVQLGLDKKTISLNIDEASAMCILQGYLDYINHKKDKEGVFWTN